MSTPELIKILTRLIIFSLLESGLIIFSITKSLTPRSVSVPVPFLMGIITGLAFFFCGMDPVIHISLLFPLIFLYCLFFFTDPLSKRLFFGLVPPVLIFLIHFFYFYILPKTLPFDLDRAYSDIWFFLGYQLILLRDTGLVMLLVVRVLRPRIRKLTPNLIFAALCLLLISLTFLILIHSRGAVETAGLTLFLNAVLTTAALLLLLWLYHFLIRFYENEQLERTRTLMKEEDLRRQEDLNSTYQSMRYLSHDTRKFMQTAQQLILSGKAEEGARLLNEYEKQLPIIYSTGCTEVDAYLTLVAARCREQHIDFKTELCPLQDLPMESMDFASLLANLLDNAVESLMQENPEKKWIDLQLMRVKNMLYIDCKNPTERTSSILSQEGQIQSTKDSSNHGLGLKIIREIVEKADGFMNIRIEGGVFQVSISLPGK